jgi:hypothetical protein
MQQPTQSHNPSRSHKSTAYADTYSKSCSAQKQSDPCPSIPEPTWPPRHRHPRLALVQTQRPSGVPSHGQTAPSWQCHFSRHCAWYGSWSAAPCWTLPGLLGIQLCAAWQTQRTTGRKRAQSVIFQSWSISSSPSLFHRVSANWRLRRKVAKPVEMKNMGISP